MNKTEGRNHWSAKVAPEKLVPKNGKFTIAPEMVAWCNDNCDKHWFVSRVHGSSCLTGRPYLTSVWVNFTSERDALMFMMFFG